MNKKNMTKRSFVYGNGKSAEKIVKILFCRFNKKKLINKKFESINFK